MINELINKLLPESFNEILALISQYRMRRQKTKQINTKNHLKISELLSNPQPIKLELGAGENRGIEDWTYADSNESCDLTLDLSQVLPLPDNCVQTIYSSHLLEHFEYHDLLNCLTESLRVLKTGGTFSAAVPNARIYLEAYRNPEGFDPGLFCRHLPAYHGNGKIDFINYVAYMAGEHRYMFDEENIVTILKRVGFRKVRLRDFDSNLDKPGRNAQSLYVLAEKG
ncbi:MAG: methyltransferase domain-containing protein [Desulfuromusa sp.]|nr:methyltransferase domain-containing protein [Desulfuromusa sp.]